MTRDETFEKTLHGIRSLQIQGAEHVARAAVEALADYIARHRALPPGPLVARLLATRPTEPMLQNAVAYLLRNADVRNAGKTARHLLATFDEADTRIAAATAGLLKDGGAYLTHCHSSTVTAALIAAHRSGKRFAVRNTETRPRLQGRITATELARAGIPVTHYVDSAARAALKGCDAVLLGADALLADGTVANKIGSEIIAELAERRDIPVYVLASSWKYVDARPREFKGLLERRAGREIWPEAPEGVVIENPAFELIAPRRITAIATELGVMEPVTVAFALRRRSSRLLPSGK